MPYELGFVQVPDEGFGLVNAQSKAGFVDQPEERKSSL